MNAEIIAIGDELLIGQVTDTNSGMIERYLGEIGVGVGQVTVVHDDAQQILAALSLACSRADLVITTGGMGPTKDDITKSVLCEFVNSRLISNSEVEKHIRTLYSDRPDVLNALTATQWMVPDKAIVLENRVGSAPLLLFQKDVLQESCPALSNGIAQCKALILLPGVPYETDIAMREQILPYISAHIVQWGGQQQILHRTLLVTGIAESALALHLADYEKALPEDIHLAYLPKDSTIRLRLSQYASADSVDNAEEQIDTEFDKLMMLVSEYLVALEDKPLELIVGEKLKSVGATISTAESCTGGTLGSLLTKHSGSSLWYKGGVVAYDNSIKRDVLGVDEQTLLRYGAVSEQTVREMAEGIRKLCGTEYSIATSGIAGPTGGTDDKPIGTVWIAWATPVGTYARCYHLGHLREQVVARTCAKALAEILKLIK